MIYQNDRTAGSHNQARAAQTGTAWLTNEDPARLAQRQTATPRDESTATVSRGQALDATGLTETRSIFREAGARKRRYTEILNEIANDSNSDGGKSVF
jgi:hypothetical protein